MKKPIRIPATGVAEFVSATEARRRSILGPYKRKQSGEAKGRSHYYRFALNTIRAFFREGNDVGVITDGIRSLELRKKGPVKRGELAKLKHNIRVLKSVLAHYANRRFQIVQGRKLECTIGKIEVTCSPDLWAKENGEVVLVKFYFSERKPNVMQIPVLLHLVREGAQNGAVAPTVICLDMDGVEHRCPQDRAKMARVLVSLENELEAVWNSVKISRQS
jgi:hypothetical protein